MPISSPASNAGSNPAGTLELKSPLNTVQIYPQMPPNAMPANENNLPLSLAAQPEETAVMSVPPMTSHPAANSNAKPHSARKSSLATLQNLDSILEESEYESSPGRKSSLSSLSSSFEEETETEVENETEEEEDFDSDASVVSDEEILNFREILERFEAETAEIVAKEQDQLLEKMLKVKFEGGDEVKNQKLEQVTETLELLQVNSCIFVGSSDAVYRESTKIICSSVQYDKTILLDLNYCTRLTCVQN